MNGFELAERPAMNEHEVRLKHISKCQTIQIFSSPSACLGMMRKTIFVNTVTYALECSLRHTPLVLD